MKTMDELMVLFEKGMITRREFITRMSALGLAAAVSTALTTSSANAAVPKKGGHFRVASDQGNTSGSFDPATFANSHDVMIGYALRNNLTELNNKSELVGELAERWDVTPDAAKWTFHLRKGVEFHNGKTLDANDVVATMNHHRGDDSKSGAKSLLSGVVDIRADGQKTVIFELKSGNADFPAVLTDYHLGILPVDSSGNVDWKDGVGTGAYIVKKYDPGVTIEMTRNPNYWKEGYGHFDSVSIPVISDPTARTTALMTKSVDAVSRTDPKTFDLLKKRSGLAFDEVPSGAHQTFAMDTRKAPFNSNDVRMALKLAMDREELMAKIFRNYGYLGNDHPVGRNIKFFAGELPQRKYDPDKARYHLKKAGMEGLKVNLSAADTPFAGAVDAAVLYKEHAAKAGIEIKVVREPNDGYWSNVWMKKPFCASGWGQRATADMIFTIAYAGDSTWNETYWQNERFNKLLVEARAELDEKKRTEMCYELQKTCRDDCGSIIFAFENFLTARRDNVQHAESVSSERSLDGFKAPERWWFA